MDDGDGVQEKEATESPLLFIYGSLMASDVLEALLQRIPPCQPGTLHGYHRYRIKDRPYPAIAPTDGAEVQGLLLCGLSADEVALLDYFEDDEYERRLVQVALASAPLLPALAGVLPNHRDALREHTGAQEPDATVEAFAYVYAQRSSSLYGQWELPKFLAAEVLPDYVEMARLCRGEYDAEQAAQA